ncbi:MAG: PAS domain S-box protein, partial [Proteobacteria bacterium]|nr:PAS domain S-box protein [Pseudomonadota bacterium]MBU1582747.1 PAS domain S-box protein [Pseudomonadota bacterium]MBU2455294.1 PAS domain S-box protein [Pseudomonadota bacterium]
MDASHSILIVEDNVIVAQDIKTRVQKMGYQVTDCVTRGESAIDSVDKNPPNLILMDIKLKGQMSGIEASAIIRSRHDIPIIYLTAYADEETLDHAKLTEPFGYIIKPFDDKDLRSALTISLYKYQMEQKLKESEERFKQLFEYAPLPYQSLDETGTIIEVNHTWLEILGYRRKDVIGKPFVDFLHPDWIRHFKENFSRFKSIGEVIEVEFEMKKKDGTYISTRFDGKIRRNQAGEFIQTHCVFKDVSKEKELQKTIEAQEIALRQNQKLEAIGNLAGGIAHDFNNILSSVIGYTELSLEDVQQGTDLHDNLVEVLNAGERAKTLVKQILTFSRKGEQEKKPIQLNPLVSDAVQMLRSTIPSN